MVNGKEKRDVPRFDSKELASYESNPYNIQGSLYSMQLGGKILLSPSDEILINRGGVDALNVYRDLLYDYSVQSAFRKLVQEITARELRVLPVSDSESDIFIANFIAKILDDLPMDDIYSGLAESLVTGVSYGEILWRSSKGGVIPYDIKIRDQRRFRFVKDLEKAGGYELRIRKSLTDFPGRLASPKKFVISRYHIANSSDPYGIGIGRILFPLIQFLRRAIESYILYTDRFSTPTAVGSVPANATVSEVDAFFEHIRNLSQEMSVVLPPGFSLEFASPSTGNPDLFMNLITYLEGVINILITGEHEAGLVEAGSYASSEVANLIRTTRAQELSQRISKDLENTLIRWVVDLNFGTDIVAPRLERSFDLTKSSLTIQDLSTLKDKFGYVPGKEWIEKQFNVELTEAPKEEATPLSSLI